MICLYDLVILITNLIQMKYQSSVDPNEISIKRYTKNYEFAALQNFLISNEPRIKK